MKAQITGVLMDVTQKNGKGDNAAKVYFNASMYESGDYPKLHNVRVKPEQFQPLLALRGKSGVMTCGLFIGEKGASLSFENFEKAA